MLLGLSPTSSFVAEDDFLDGEVMEALTSRGARGLVGLDDDIVAERFYLDKQSILCYRKMSFGRNTGFEIYCFR